MSEKKPSYADLVVQVVREAPEPLRFAEILERVNALFPITTRNPKSTIRNAVSQSRLVVSTGDGRYGWKYRLINGAVIRLPLTEANLAQRQVIYSDELRDALWPAFFEIKKHSDRGPVHLTLPSGKTVEWSLAFLGIGIWGTNGSSEFWEWLEASGAQPGDELIFHVVDGEARQYALGLKPRSEQDEQAITARNQQILQAVARYNQGSRAFIAIWDVSSHLLSTGQYHHSIPPDPLKILLKDHLWSPDVDLFSNLETPGWMLTKEPAIDPLVASLLEQIGEPPRQRKGKKAAAQPLGSHRIFQIKVTLEGIHLPIWRRIHAPGDLTLPELHAVLQIAMGWTNSHLHGFRVGEQFYTEPDPDYADMAVVDERLVRLHQIAPEVGARFVYEYDFGDSWEHTVVVEQILPSETGVAYPRCIDGKRACPPEDVGGVHGYMEFLVAIHNPRHPEHDEWLDWAGNSFDPEAFDLQKVNQLIQAFYSRLIESA
jgi:hypothetical protein